jgi:hypothetical protein
MEMYVPRRLCGRSVWIVTFDVPMEKLLAPW